MNYFQNVITVTHQFDVDGEEIIQQVCAVIQTRMPVHNPNQTIVDEKKIARQNLSPEQQKIEEILDRTIRPGLQGDGGDIEVTGFENHILTVVFQGACGGCPSSTMGTLNAIEGILQEQFDPAIRVVPQGMESYYGV